MRAPNRATAFAKAMWQWFPAHKRTLPWRALSLADETQRAYMILVSEVMLQQTQVARVEVLFKRFLREFPTIHDLARASNREVILAWRGMGYNSRAIRLRDAAREIVEKFLGGGFPRGMAELQSIRGIGLYTAGAIRNFAFNLPTPCVDTNIERILHRVFVGPKRPDGSRKHGEKQMLALADRLLSFALETAVPPSLTKRQKRTANWHAALMDFGSLVCRKNKPRCEECPMAQGICKSAFRVKMQERDATSMKSREPGRLVGSVFVPNRIVRGRVVEALRDAHAGLTLEQIGKQISVDWSTVRHRKWLANILSTLARDQLVTRRKSKYLL